MEPQSQQPQPVQPPTAAYTPELLAPSEQEARATRQQTPLVNTPETPVLVAPPIQPLAPTQPVNPTPTQPLAPAVELATPSDLKKVKILGYSLLITGLLSVVLGVASSYAIGTGFSFDFTYLAGIIQALIGVGLLKHSKFAMYAFNVLAVLAILGTLLTLGFLLLFLSIFSGADWSNMASPFLLLIFAYFAAVIAWIVWGLFILHPKRVRRIFH